MAAYVHEILLRAHPALINMVDRGGETALHIAAIQGVCTSPLLFDYYEFFSSALFFFLILIRKKRHTGESPRCDPNVVGDAQCVCERAVFAGPADPAAQAGGWALRQRTPGRGAVEDESRRACEGHQVNTIFFPALSFPVLVCVCVCVCVLYVLFIDTF